VKNTILTLILFLVFVTFIRGQQNVSINKDGSNPDPSAILDVKSNNQGVLVPRLTSEQRLAISAPANGLLAYDITTNSFWYFQQDRWIEIGGSGLGNLTLPLPTPVITQSLPTGPGFPLLDVQGNYLYLTKNTTENEVEPDSLIVIDASDPFSLQIMGKRLIGSGPAAMAVQGQYAYITDSVNDNLRILDISDPNAPDSIGQVSLGNNPNGLAVQGNYAYTIDIQDDFLRIIDVSDASNPSQVGALGIGQLPIALAVQGDSLYIIDG